MKHLRKSFPVPKLMKLDGELYRYDATDGGWQFHDCGTEVNVRHIQNELGRLDTRKPLYEPETITQEIAPDMLQYAFRLSRYIGAERSLWIPAPNVGTDVVAYGERMHMRTDDLALHVCALGLARANISTGLHDYDHILHTDNPDQGLLNIEMYRLAENVIPVLAYSAMVASVVYDFDISEVFEARIRQLREKSAIDE